MSEKTVEGLNFRFPSSMPTMVSTKKKNPYNVAAWGSVKRKVIVWSLWILISLFSLYIQLKYNSTMPYMDRIDDFLLNTNIESIKDFFARYVEYLSWHGVSRLDQVYEYATIAVLAWIITALINLIFIYPFFYDRKSAQVWEEEHKNDGPVDLDIKSEQTALKNFEDIKKENYERINNLDTYLDLFKVLEQTSVAFYVNKETFTKKFDGTLSKECEKVTHDSLVAKRFFAEFKDEIKQNTLYEKYEEKLNTNTDIYPADLLNIYHYAEVFDRLGLLALWKDNASLSVNALNRIEVGNLDFLLDLLNDMKRLEKDHQEYYRKYNLSIFKEVIKNKIKNYFENKLDNDRHFINDYIRNAIALDKEECSESGFGIEAHTIPGLLDIRHIITRTEEGAILLDAMQHYFTTFPENISKNEFIHTLPFLYADMPNGIIENKYNEFNAEDVLKIVKKFKVWPESLMQLNPGLFAKDSLYQEIYNILGHHPSYQIIEEIFNNNTYRDLPHLDLLEMMANNTQYSLVSQCSNSTVLDKIKDSYFDTSDKNPQLLRNNYFVVLGLIQNSMTDDHDYKSLFEDIMTDNWTDLNLLMILDENTLFRQQMEKSSLRDVKAQIDNLSHKTNEAKKSTEAIQQQAESARKIEKHAQEQAKEAALQSKLQEQQAEQAKRQADYQQQQAEQAKRQADYQQQQAQEAKRQADYQKQSASNSEAAKKASQQAQRDAQATKEKIDRIIR